MDFAVMGDGVTRSEWSLTAELCSIAGALDIRAAVSSMGLIEQRDDEFQLVEISSEWQRGGSETYHFVFAVLSHSLGMRKCIMKATVTDDMSMSVSDYTVELLSRRQVLVANGVQTPRLYGVRRAVLVEEYIEEVLVDCLVDSSALPSLSRSLAGLALGVEKSGFRPLSLLSDLRSRGGDAVLIDYGWDLGPSDLSSTTNRHTLDLLISELHRALGAKALPLALQLAADYNEARRHA